MRKVVPVVFVVVLFAVILRSRHSADSQDQPAPADVVQAPSEQEPAVDGAQPTWPPLQNVGAAAIPSNVVNYYIVVDGSGSMAGRQCADGNTKMIAAVQAVRGFISSAPASANIGMAAFDSYAISERVALGVGNRDALAEALEDIRTGSGTPLKSGIRIGYDRLTDQARSQLGYGEYHLIVVTDGVPEPRSEDPTPVVEEILSESPVVLHTIGFCIDASHVLNQQGRTYYASASNPQELQGSLQAVLAEAPVFDVSQFQ